MRVVICDDNVMELDDCYDKVVGLKLHKKIPMEVVKYNNASKLLFDAENVGYTIDIAYLDIMMPEIDGFSVARKLLSINRNCQIVFVTNVQNRWDSAFALGAKDYFIKNNFTNERFVKTFERCIEAYRDGLQETAVFSRAGETCNIPISHIKYFEVNKKLVTVYYTVHNKAKSFTFYTPISKIEENFAARGFVRVHRGYLVQRDFVERASCNSVILLSGEVIPVGRSYRHAVKDLIPE